MKPNFVNRNRSNIQGYFVWSFVDCVELAPVKVVTFGLYYVDSNDKDLKRYPTPSSQWHSNFLLQGKRKISRHMSKQASMTCSAE
ncbi:hypothetical protein AMTRI_Chr06g191070 [Amborella trichopoda]